ncbi:TPA: phosphoethanolamine transferase [Escherichia coli]|uniref:phosphoethanolamine transferase n=1 Tax=Escherichia coli TaxID=562 RepID=UPI001AECA08C|nr:phosphoethanolamine--lipid A transferase [Escherichia coli]MBP2792093.1 phosphoethanolamine--lipid A transferase [Escherichia coli]
MPVFFKIKIIPLILLLSLFFAVILNYPLLQHLHSILTTLEHVQIGFVISIPFVLIAALNFLFTIFSFRFILKIFFSLLLLSGSVVSYSALKYKVIFDQVMIQNILETNQQEASSYINSSIILWFLFTGFLPTLFLLFAKVEYPSKWYKGVLYRFISMSASLFVLAGISAIYYKDYASVGRNNPTLNKEIIPANYVYSGLRYIQSTYFTNVKPFKILGEDAIRKTRGKKPVLMFLVVGETARSQNFSVNGYKRNTNIFTDKQGGIVSFKNFYSCGTATAVSVPCMFSNLERANFNKKEAANRENVLDIIQKTGISVLWLENDGGCKGVCKRIPTIEIKPSDDHKLCNDKTCYDEVMLKYIDKNITENHGDKLIAFHMTGSHGPTYYQRYPVEHRYFQPDCRRSDIENCTKEQLINTYDNTIRYTDYVLSKLIEKLKNYSDKYDPVLIYISDHGESLGENGLYLHGTPYKFAPEEQTRVPFLIWMSSGFISEKEIDMNCLIKKAKNNSYSHDNLFSSLLGLWDIKTNIYNSENDIFYSCRN